jgi:outer membrane biosynthesis protein TonB
VATSAQENTSLKGANYRGSFAESTRVTFGVNMRFRFTIPGLIGIRINLKNVFDPAGRVLTRHVAWAALACVPLLPMGLSSQGRRSQKPVPAKRESGSELAGQWKVQTSHDEMTDSLQLSVYADADGAIRVSYQNVVPRLSIQCRSSELAIAFYVGGPSHDDEIDLRFDDGEVLNLEMIRSTNLRWLFVANFGDHDVMDILKRISQARRLRVRFTPYVESPVTFAFDVRGLKPLLSRLERAGCRTTKPISVERSDSAAPDVAASEPAEVATTDGLTVRSDGVEFPFPGYLNNVVRQIALNFKPRNPSAPSKAEVRFLIHPDGSVSDLTFVRRSGNFSFDLEAQGAVETSSSIRAFGPLPSGFRGGVLPVVFGFGRSAATDQAQKRQTYFEFQVEKPADVLQDSPKPTYPSALESSGLSGEVQAQFVVNSEGKVDMDSFKVLKSTNELFTQVVRNVLPRMRFSPAQIDGRAVNQLVQRSFQFEVPHSAPEEVRDYPPTLRDLFIPPMPVPRSVKTVHMAAYFDVDEKGNSTLLSFTALPDTIYSKRVAEVLKGLRFRPGVRADGTPKRDTVDVHFIF